MRLLNVTHPLMPVMRKMRLPLILVQLTNLLILLASTVWAVCRLPVPMPSHTDKAEANTNTCCVIQENYHISCFIYERITCCGAYSECPCAAQTSFQNLLLAFFILYLKNTPSLLGRRQSRGPSPCIEFIWWKHRPIHGQLLSLMISLHLH